MRFFPLFFATMSSANKLAARPVISKISSPALSAYYYRDDTSKDTSNNQHFPISVNLAQSFNGKRRPRRPARRNHQLFRESETDMSISR